MLLFSTAHGQKRSKKSMESMFIDVYTVFCFFQRNNGEHASKGPCRPGFSQSFYSLLIPRDVLQGQGIVKGKIFNRRVDSFTLCPHGSTPRLK